ncbi:MAG: immunoglobulin-like domain-containing protein, partial [Clostridia bacterium]|nr:immunoglobulin-like domain-containing protein [Clostridia bacterium]
NFSHTLSETEWSTYTISINTYTGETSFACDGTTSSLDACAAGVGAKVGSFYFYIERNSAVGYFYIDDITVTNNNIDTLTFAEVTGDAEAGNTVSGNLPTAFSDLGASWSVVWSGDDVANDGSTVNHTLEEKTDASLTASFYDAESNLVGSKTFTGITIAAFDPAAALTFNTIKGSNTAQGAITSALNLVSSLQSGGESYPVTWASSHPDVISSTGTVVRTAFDQPVILTATINGSVEKKFHLNVAAERTDLYFGEDLTNATLPTSYTTWSATTTETWTLSSSTALNQEIPSLADDPSGAEENQVLEIKKIATRDSSQSALNGATGLYRRLETITADGGAVQYVSFDIYPTATTARTEMRIFDANGTRVAGISYLNKSERTFLQAFNGSNSIAFENQTGNIDVAVDTWSNITIKLDYTNKIAETYLNGNYVGYYPLNSECQQLAYLYLGMERNEKNPATGAAFDASNPGFVYFDNITVRTAADEADGIYEVLSYEGGTLKLRKIVNTDKDTTLIAASYETNGNLIQAKLVELGTGNDLPSIITIEDFGVSGDKVKIFNWEMDTLAPV